MGWRANEHGLTRRLPDALLSLPCPGHGCGVGWLTSGRPHGCEDARSSLLHSSNANRACPLPVAVLAKGEFETCEGPKRRISHYFVGGADHALGLELGNCLVVLFPAPVDAAALMYGSRRPEELMQTLVEQRVLAVILFGHLTGRWHPSQAGSDLTVVLARWHRFSRWQPLGCRMGRLKSFRMS